MLACVRVLRLCAAGPPSGVFNIQGPRTLTSLVWNGGTVAIQLAQTVTLANCAFNGTVQLETNNANVVVSAAAPISGQYTASLLLD